MANGIIDSVFSILGRHPSVAAGTCTFTVAFALVSGNAFYSQSGNHPDPIWATRDNATTQSINITIPEVRAVKTTSVKPKHFPIPTKRNTSVKLGIVADIQNILKSTGEYNGNVDGAIGPITRTAIKAYQKRHDLKVDGYATKDLLNSMKINLPSGIKVSSNDPLSGLISKDQAKLPDSSAFGYDSALVEKIQLGLVKDGITPMEVDGIFGKKTQSAIVSFQRKHNLDVTGKPDQKVLEKMIKLGTITQS